MMDETKNFEDIEELISYRQTLPKNTRVENEYGEDLRVHVYSDPFGGTYADFE